MQAESLTTQHHSTKQAANCREYLLLIYPQSGKNTNAHPRPGPIELASFEAKEVMEATIIRWMHRILSTQPQFTMQIAQQRNEQGLYLRIADRSVFQRMANNMRVISQYLSSYGCGEMQFQLKLHTAVLSAVADPAYHLQLAGAAINYEGQYQVQSIVLMKRQHARDAYKQVNVFALYP
ncbi:MAG: hypothetical protein ACRCSM_12905 [Sediminibacterium sp.]|jgi:hypothetical protein|nr:hypothetical protein [Chitinophagaceae bacterium]MCA6447765.1 hypothetical protein [Chitinophagaceae bacterium]